MVDSSGPWQIVKSFVDKDEKIGAAVVIATQDQLQQDGAVTIDKRLQRLVVLRGDPTSPIPPSTVVEEDYQLYGVIVSQAGLAPCACIVWHHDQTGETQIWFMNEHQLVRRASVLGEDGQPALIGPPFRIVGIADMNADGKADIIWHHDQTGETQIWFMNEHQLVRRASVLGEDGQPALIGPPFRIVGVAIAK